MSRSQRATSKTRFRVRSVLLVAAVTIGLVAVACGGDDSGSSGGSAGASGSGMSLRITTPANAAQVSEPFTVQVDASEALGKEDTGLHHVHLYYDGETAEGDYDKVYDNRFEVTRLSSGTHEIQASLRNADHSDAGPSDTITVTVVGDDSAPPTSGANDGGPGY